MPALATSAAEAVIEAVGVAKSVGVIIQNESDLAALQWGSSMNGTHLHSAKLRTVSSIVKFVAVLPIATLDCTIASQMIREGIRKLHDCATSSRGHGKYLGHAHWSRAALKHLEQNGGATSGITKLLAHEHVVPVGIVVSELLKGGQKTEIEIEKLILRLSVVAIITREEEALLSEAKLRSRMPDDWDGHDIWARYRAVGLYECIKSVPE